MGQLLICSLQLHICGFDRYCVTFVISLRHLIYVENKKVQAQVKLFDKHT